MLLAVPDAAGSARCFWQCPMLLAVLDAAGSARSSWHCSILLAVPDLPGSARCCWQCPILLAVLDAAGSARSSWQCPMLLAVPDLFPPPFLRRFDVVFQSLSPIVAAEAPVTGQDNASVKTVQLLQKSQSCCCLLISSIHLVIKIIINCCRVYSITLKFPTIMNC